MSEPLPLDDVFAAAGGRAALAAACGIDRTTTYSWKRVPAERLRQVAKATGIPEEKLRPDLYEAA